MEVGKIDRQGEEVAVVVRAAEGHKTIVKALSHVSTEDGRQLPMALLGHFEQRQSASSVRRNNNFRYVIISSDIDSSQRTVHQVQREIEELQGRLSLPAGVWWQQKGDFSEVSEGCDLNLMWRFSP